MKQNLPPAKLVRVIFMLGLIMFTSACARLPRQASSELQSNLDSPNAEKATPININTAGPQELEKLPGIGKGIAERIVKHRQQFGGFRRPEHLMMVRGISDRKFRAVRELVAVD